MHNFHAVCKIKYYVCQYDAITAKKAHKKVNKTWPEQKNRSIWTRAHLAFCHIIS